MGRGWRGTLFITLAALLLSVSTAAQKDAQKTTAPVRGVQIVSNGNEPELRVGGVPFFLHAAQFDYFRIPADLWFPSLSRYKELGINTIDLRIPWNWHEPGDGEFDFDGHSNPRRNLRGLLQLISQMRLKLIVRPGPLVGDQWRNAGYPAWLLAYSNYKMSPAAVQRGAAPPEAELASRDANSAAQLWLANEIHMTYARRWLTAVARELAPFSAKNTITITEGGDREGETQENEIAGPLLFVALDDIWATRPGSPAPELLRYLAGLRGALIRGGLDTLSFLNAPDAGAQGAASVSIGSPEEGQSPVGLAGQWFFQPSVAPSGAPAPPRLLIQRSFLKLDDASSLIFLAKSLGTQPEFPTFLSGFATTTFASAGDPRAAQPPPENMLLASRLLIGSGLRAFEYSPLQDTLTPAGWETPSASRYFRWDAALDLAGNRGSRAIAVARNGNFISAWGAMLASSHPRSDFGIVDLRTCAPASDPAMNSRNALAIDQLFRVAEVAGFEPDLVNPAAQPVERLLRDAIILLPVPEENGASLKLSEQAQLALVEFVRRGGVLVYFPSRPQGALLEPLWSGSPKGAATADSSSEWGFERGRVISYSIDFLPAISLAGDRTQNQTPPPSSTAIAALTALLGHAGVVAGLRRTGNAQDTANLIVTQLVSNEVPATNEPVQKCVEGQLCAAALVSVTNLDPDQAASGSFEIIDPRSGASQTSRSKISVDITVPARESLLLPIHAPLCSATYAGDHCSDEVVAAGAELLRADRDGKTLRLTFYAPARAVVRLHLESEPSKVELDPDMRLDDQWKQETSELEVSMLRGAAPDYLRILLVHLRYTPHVVEKPDPSKSPRRGSEYEVFDALRFPLAGDATIQTSPPLLVANPASGGSTVIASTNHTETLRTADFDIEGAFHGTAGARMFGSEKVFTHLRFQPTKNSGSGGTGADSASDGLLQGTLAIHSGREHANSPVLFIPANDTADTHYQYDFDRDGAPEWVLESPRLRMIVSPADGGRALAVVDKSTNDDLITLGGALHDFIVPAGATSKDALQEGDFSFNQAYQAEWVAESQDISLRLTFREFEKSTAGVHVEKTLRLAAPETVATSYRISFVASAFSFLSGNVATRNSFVSTLSVPAATGEEGVTQFCWEPTPPPVSSPSSTMTNPAAPTPASPASHCEDFISSGPSIPVPDGIVRVKLVSPGRPTLTVEWTAGQMVIVPGTFSAGLNLVTPLPASTAPPAEFTLRYTVESGQ